LITLVFEDEGHVALSPLAYTKPVFELKCGAFSMLDRLAAALASTAPRIALACRPYLAPLLRRRRPGALVNDPGGVDEEALLVNGRALPLSVELSKLAERRVAWVKDGWLVACLLSEG